MIIFKIILGIAAVLAFIELVIGNNPLHLNLFDAVVVIMGVGLWKTC